MENPRQITVIQTAAILISTIIGVGVLPLPQFAVTAADAGAPLVTFLGGALAFVGLILITILGKRFPTKDIIQYSEEILGKGIAWIGSLLIIAFFAILTSLAAREFGEVVVTSVLQRTPLEVTVTVMLLLAAFSARNGIGTFTYIHHFYLPAIVFPALLIVMLSFKNAEALNLLPVWGNDPSGMLKGVLTIAALFQGSFILTMVIPYMRRPSKALKASMWGILIAGGMYLITVIAAVGVFGAEETKILLWPTLELAKTTSLPANVLERLDAAFLAVWVTAVFTTLYATYYLTVHAMSKLLRLRDHKMFSLSMLPYVFIIAMMPRSVVNMYNVIVLVGRIGLFITIGYPAILLLVAVLRKKRGESIERVEQ